MVGSILLDPLVAGIATFVAAVVLLTWSGYLRQKSESLLSNLIHHWLLIRYPVKAIHNAHPIPTCPYKWPNGQGDVEKFLNGERNSKIWSAEYGRTYRLWSGMQPEIVLRHPVDIQTVFKDSDQHTKAVDNNSGWLMGELLGKCLGLISGNAYKRVKAAFGAHFSYKKASTYLPIIQKITKAHLETLATQVKMRQNLLNPVSDLRWLPFWIMADILYGQALTEEFKENLKTIASIRESLWAKVIQGGHSRFFWSQYFPLQASRELREFKRKWAKLNEELYASCLLSKNRPMIVSMYEEMERGNIDLSHLLQTIDEMLFANLDVTMGSLSWNLLFLAANKDVQDHIWLEISQAEGASATDPAVSGWDEYIRSSSTWLAAAITESGRLKPLAAFSVPQSAPTDRAVGGFLIPAGTDFIVDTHALNIENPFWGSDGHLYRPARFLENKRVDMRYHFWRWGFGPRQCLGRHVVELVVRVVVAELVRNYRLSLTEATSWDKNPSTWILHPDTEVRCENRHVMGHT